MAATVWLLKVHIERRCVVSSLLPMVAGAGGIPVHQRRH
jgi:hypothetical protein